MEVIVKAKTVEEAVALGAAKLDKDIKDVKYDVIEEAKKGFLGMFSAEAEVKVYADDPETTEKTESTDADVQNEEALEALGEAVDEKTCAEDLPPVQDKVIEFLNTIISDMGVDAEAKVVGIDERLSENSKTYEKDIRIEITGKGLGMLIGRHGDVLDSLQYLCNIVVGRYPKRSDKHEYVRLKREETLKALASRMASKVLATGRNFTLEPMSSYERRVIHSEVQNIKGVHTFSVGT